MIKLREKKKPNKKYNWWTDPKNREEVNRLSWWDHPENRTYYQLPISVVEHDGKFTATPNNETRELLGEHFTGCAQGDTKEEAIRKMFLLCKIHFDYNDECRLKYQRWVPIRVGDWSRIGGRWLVIFGMHFNFRYGKNMKYGWFIPFTYLNISFSNEWKAYREYIKERQLK